MMGQERTILTHACPHWKVDDEFRETRIPLRPYNTPSSWIADVLG